MTGGQIAAALLRGCHLLALVSVMGTVLFSPVVMRGIPANQWPVLADRRLASLLRASLAFALVSGIAWFAERAVAMAGADSLRATLVALPVVAWDTRFGRLLLLRGALLLVLLVIARRRRAWPLAIMLAAGALGLQAATSHAGAIGGPVGHAMVISESLHILAAGAWLGALVPLLIVLASAPGQTRAAMLRRFFPLGIIAVGALSLTSVVQASQFVGSVPALIGTAYGRMVLLKLTLFLLMLALAMLNRSVLAKRAGAWLRRSITGEVALAVGLMLAAGSLAQLTPGTHEQPVWPFPWRLNPGAAGPWLIPANPASYFVSPTGFAAAAIVRGEDAFQSACAGCHGAAARGDGDVARSLPIAPADLTDQRLMALSDGDLFWRVGHATELPEDTRWDIVDYLRAHNRGEFVRRAGRGVHALRIPGFSANCGDGRILTIGGLHGAALRITVPAAERTRPPPGPDSPVITVALTGGPDEPCLAQPEALAAFAILLGTTPAALTGTEFLIDPNMWLRGRWRPGEAGGWGTPELLLARAGVITDHPLPMDAAAQPHRH